MFLISVLLPLVLLGGLTIVIAGTVASLLVFQSGATRYMVINGATGTALSYLVVALEPIPGLVQIQLNAVTVYPVWATAAALAIAVVWRLALMLLPREPSADEREAERVRRARERAARYGP